MRFLTIAALLRAVLITPSGVIAQDVEGWYDAHPGLPRINQVDQHQIVDEFGRIRFFHGTNVVMKQAPWHHPMEWEPGVPSFGEQDVQNLRKLGLNIVRLGHSWAGAEPTRGDYNQTFLDIMKLQTKLAEEHGIYVLVDVHQDVLAPQFCGNGAPEWFAKKGWVKSHLGYPAPMALPFPVDDDGMIVSEPGESPQGPPLKICNQVDWALSYTSVAVGNAFGRLYNNYDGLGDAFAAYWKKLASEYADTVNIVGYNLLNEPWVGDTWADPTLLIPGVADAKVMEGLWNRATKQIRTVDNDTLIWFEGATIDILSGFENAPLGDGSKSVHSWHYYGPPQLGSIHDTIYNRNKDNERLGTAGVLTEFTFWIGDQGEGTPAKMEDLEEAVAATDANMVSWIGWAYNFLYNGTTGQPFPELVKHYSRPYPAAVAGTPKSYGFDEGSGTFNLEFTADPNIDAPTEIILPKPKFPDGYSVQISPEGSLLQHLPDDRTLALFTNVEDATDIHVTITRKWLKHESR